MAAQNDIEDFIPLQNVDTVIPILKSRLPIASHIYNLAVTIDRFQDRIQFYTLGPQLNNDSWIAVVSQREDYGPDVSISAPKNPIITSNIKDVFANTSIWNWDLPHLFVAMDKPISKMISEISVDIKGNNVSIHPCYLFYMPIEDAKNLSIVEKPNDLTEVKRLDNNLGVQFILSTWKYATKGTDDYVRLVVDKNESGAVYFNGQPVAGVMTVVDGLLTALYTLKDHRQKGYAKMALQYAMKISAENGVIPCLTVENRNGPSKSFQLKCGLKIAGEVDWIRYDEPNFD